MRKLSEYKKAEKCVAEIAADYEKMKQKYFNVLQETEKQKRQIAEHIQRESKHDTKLKILNEENVKLAGHIQTISEKLGKRQL